MAFYAQAFKPDPRTLIDITLPTSPREKFVVPLTMERVGHERERVHLRRGNRHARWIRSRVDRLDPRPAAVRVDPMRSTMVSKRIVNPSPGLLTRRFCRSLFTSLTGYFARPGFASTALGAVSGGVGAVALFNAAIRQTIAVRASFQGLYTPISACSCDPMTCARHTRRPAPRVVATRHSMHTSP